MEFESGSEMQSWLHVGMEQMGRFCQGGNFPYRKAIRSVHFIQKKCVFWLLWSKGYDRGSGALWFAQWNACSLETGLPTLCVCEVCNGIYSRISSLESYPKVLFYNK